MIDDAKLGDFFALDAAGESKEYGSANNYEKAA